MTSRAKGIQKIIFLHDKKGYKKETLFLACNIFDRYLMIVGQWNFPTEMIPALSCCSYMLATKCEEEYDPSFEFI